MSEKVYVNSAFFDEKVFDDGGSIIKVSIKNVDDFIKFVKENANKDKSLKLVISKKKNVEEGKSSHYSYVDTFVPRSQNTQLPPAKTKPTKKVVAAEPEVEDVPI
jgi:hypothetical protein